MAKTKLKTSLPQPGKDVLGSEEERREKAERNARGLLDGRLLKRKNRQFQIGIKTTEAVKKEFDRIRVLTGLSYTEIFENAMAAYKRELDAELEGGK